MEKIEKDKADGTFVAVFKVNDLSSKKNRYKVDIHASLRSTTRCFSAVSRPFCAAFPPFFLALSGFLAPRRRERAKDGVKWAKFGGETAPKPRY